MVGEWSLPFYLAQSFITGRHSFKRESRSLRNSHICWCKIPASANLSILGGVFSNTSLLSAVYFTEFPNFKFENHQELNIEIPLFTKDFLLNSGVSEPAHLFYSHLILLIVFSANSLQNEGQNYKTRFYIQFIHFKQCK